MVRELRVAGGRCFWRKKPVSPTFLQRYFFSNHPPSMPAAAYKKPESSDRALGQYRLIKER